MVHPREEKFQHQYAHPYFGEEKTTAALLDCVYQLLAHSWRATSCSGTWPSKQSASWCYQAWRSGKGAPAQIFRGIPTHHAWSLLLPPQWRCGSRHHSIQLFFVLVWWEVSIRLSIGPTDGSVRSAGSPVYGTLPATTGKSTWNATTGRASKTWAPTWQQPEI